jgi:cellulose/xylan binding protein with CBM9 domain
MFKMLKTKNLLCILGCLVLFSATAKEQIIYSSNNIRSGILKPYRQKAPFAKIRLLADKTVEVKIDSPQKLTGVRLSKNIKVENNKKYFFEAEVKGNGKLMLAIYGRGWRFSGKATLNADQWQKVKVKYFTSNIKFLSILALLSAPQKGDYVKIRNIKFIQKDNKVYKAVDVPGKWLESEQCVFFKGGKIKTAPEASNGEYTWGKRYYCLAQFDLPETSKPLYVWGRFKSFAPDTKVHLYSKSYNSKYLSVPNDGKWHFIRFGAVRKSDEYVRLSVSGNSTVEAGLDAVVVSTDKNLAPESLRPINLKKGLVAIAPLKGTINLDGKLDEKVWRNNVVLTDFYLKGENNKATAQTRAMLTYDDKYLYVGMYCAEPSLDPLGNVMDKFKRDIKQKDAKNVYNDDCVVILLGADNAKKGFKDIVINANGVIADADYPAPKFWGAMNAKWDSQAVAATQVGNAFWTVEVKIPLESIGSIDKNWSFLLGRMRQTEKERSAWQPFTGGWHLPQNLGTLVFGKQNIPLEPAKSTSFDYGKNVLSFKLKKALKEPLQINAIVQENGKQGQIFTKIYPAGTKKLQFVYDVKTLNNINFSYQIFSPASGISFLQSPVYSARVVSSQLQASLPKSAKLFVNEQVYTKGSPLNKGINVLALQLSKAGAVKLKTTSMDIPSGAWKYSATEQKSWIAKNFKDASWQITDNLDKAGYYRRLVVVEQAVIWPNWEQKGFNICQDSTPVLHFVPEGIKGKVIEDYTLVVEVPEFCSIDGASGYSRTYKDLQFKSLGKTQRSGKTYNKYTITLPNRKKYNVIIAPHRLLALVLRTHKTKEKFAQLYYYSEANQGYIQEVPRMLKLNILSELRGKQPKKLMFQLWAAAFSLNDKKMEASVVETFTKMGLNESTSHGKGIKKFGLLGFASWYLDMRPYLKDHPDHAFIDYKNKKLIALKKAGRYNFVCTEILTGDEKCKEFLKKTVIEYVKRKKLQVAHWDYEARAFTGGLACYCPSCLEVFKKKNNITGTLTPKIIKEKYPEQWISHLGDNIAKLAALFKEYLHAADKPVEFWMYSAYQDKKLRAHYSVDWSKLAGKVDFASCGYGRSIKQINDTKKALKGTPVVFGALAYPYKISLREYPTNFSKNRLLRRLLDSRSGVLLYSYASLDGKTFHNIGEATRFASDYEDLILTGKAAENMANIRGVRKGDYYVFAKDGQVMIALFNDSKQSVNAKIELSFTGKMKEYYDNKLEQNGKTITLTLPGQSVRILTK